MSLTKLYFSGTFLRKDFIYKVLPNRFLSKYRLKKDTKFCKKRPVDVNHVSLHMTSALEAAPKRLYSCDALLKDGSTGKDKVTKLSTEDQSVDKIKKGLVLGVYEEGQQFVLTPAAEEVNQKSGGKLCQHLNELTCQLKLGKAFVVTDLTVEYPAVAIAALGPKDPGFDSSEQLDRTRENIRWGVGAGVRALAGRGCARVAVAAGAPADAAAEAAELAAWRFQEFKSCVSRDPEPVVSLHGAAAEAEAGAWRVGAERARAQNWARYLADMPANAMTPVDLAQAALDVLCPLGVRVQAHDAPWAVAQRMQLFLGVARGSCAPPVLLECEYRGGAEGDAPVLIVAKGLTFDRQVIFDEPKKTEVLPLFHAFSGCHSVSSFARKRTKSAFEAWTSYLAATEGLKIAKDGNLDEAYPILENCHCFFDSGGLCLRPGSLSEGRGGVAGAAAALAALRAVATLKVPLNVVACIPLCENMVSGQCMKVGDVMQALNGLSVQVEDTGRAGRLVLADALVLGQARHRPRLVLDVASLSEGALQAMGSGAFACFSNCERSWRVLRRAGALSGDRPWRFPLWHYYQRQITDDPAVDLRNKGSGRAIPCIGAAFLRNFVCGPWLHLDIAGAEGGAGDEGGAGPPYLRARRASGRPARTLCMALELIAEADAAKKAEDETDK